jgi:hypothetical protein
MKLLNTCVALILTGIISGSSHADERIEMETTIIKGNKELPKILFIVPWQDAKQTKGEEHELVIHSLYGDLFDPVVPDGPSGTLSEQ